MKYKEFISNIILSRGRELPSNVYFERHHIIPRCIGGTDEYENLIDLYPNEHFEVHRLLAIENPDEYKLAFAFHMMSCVKSRYTNERYQCTKEEYEAAKLARSIAMKNLPPEKSPHYGCLHSDETKYKISQSKKNNPVKYWNGKHLPKEMKDKISKSKQKPVAQYSVDGNFICIYESIMDAYSKTSVCMTGISRCCRNLRKTAGGYIWKYI